MFWWPSWYDDFCLGFLLEHFWQWLPDLPNKAKRRKYVKVHLLPYQREGILSRRLGSGCYETNFGSWLLILLKNRSRPGLPNVLVMFLRTVGLSCHFIVSSSFPQYKSASTLPQLGICASEILVSCLNAIPRFLSPVNYNFQTFGFLYGHMVNVVDFCCVIIHITLKCLKS